MSINVWECGECKQQRRTKDGAPQCCGATMSICLTPPNVKLMEKTDEEHNKSQVKDSQKMLKERSRKHSTKTELTDIIDKVDNAEVTAKSGWLNADGKIRKAIDDI